MYKKGFTLIELLVVIAIIGILSSIVVAGLSGAKASGRDAKRISDIKNLQLSLALYYNDNTKYPSPLSLLVSGDYISTLPKDPSTGADYFYRVYGTGANCSGASTPAIKYHLLTGLETASMPDDDINSITGYTLCSSNPSNPPEYTGSAVDCENTDTDERCYGVTN